MTTRGLSSSFAVTERGGVREVTDPQGRPLLAHYRCFAVVGPVGGPVAVRSFSRLQGAKF